MNVVVCVKQIPDPALPGKLDPSTKTLERVGKPGLKPQKRKVIVMLRTVTRIRLTAIDWAVAVPTSTGPPRTR